MSAARVYDIHETPAVYSTSPREGERMMNHGRVPISVARSTSLSLGARSLYAALASYANQDFKCWPSRVQLAEDLASSVRSVAKWLNELEKAGAISRTDRTGTTTMYTLTANRYTEGGRNQSAQGVGTLVPGGRNESAQGGEPECPRNSDNNSFNTSLSTAREAEPDSPPPKPIGPETPFNPHHHPPTDEAITEGAKIDGINPEDAVTCADYYRGRGWIDKNENPIRDWRAAIRSAVKNSKKLNRASNGKTQRPNPASAGGYKSAYERRASEGRDQKAIDRAIWLEQRAAERGDDASESRRLPTAD